MNPEISKLVSRMRRTADRVTEHATLSPVLRSEIGTDLRQGANTIEDIEGERAYAEHQRGRRLGRSLTDALHDWFEGEFGVQPKVDIQPDSFPGQMQIIVSAQWFEPAAEGELVAPIYRDVRINVGVRTQT